jgi:hypothetical protein
MIAAVETGVIGFRSHLEECESCRILFELLSKFWTDRTQELPQSSRRLLRRIEAIHTDSGRGRRVPVVTGRIVSDSWSRMASVQLRGVVTDLTRRLCLKAGQIELELTAERHLDIWEFAARVYERGRASQGFVIKIGGRKVPAGPLGFYYWSSKRPPGRVWLLRDSHIIEFDGLSW